MKTIYAINNTEYDWDDSSTETKKCLFFVDDIETAQNIVEVFGLGIEYTCEVPTPEYLPLEQPISYKKDSNVSQIDVMIQREHNRRINETNKEINRKNNLIRVEYETACREDEKNFINNRLHKYKFSEELLSKITPLLDYNHNVSYEQFPLFEKE